MVSTFSPLSHSRRLPRTFNPWLQARRPTLNALSSFAWANDFPAARVPLVFFCIAVTLPVFAGETAWQEIAPGAQLRLITSDSKTAAGSTWAAIEMTLAPGQKTYWHVAGETGVPTVVGLAGSVGVLEHQVFWPMPRREAKQGLVDYVYYDTVVIPIELTLAAEAPVLEMQLDLGICSQICVPVRAELSARLDFALPDRSQGLRIRQALAEVPQLWPGASPFRSVRYSAKDQALRLDLAGHDLDLDSVIADTGNPAQVFGVPQKSPDGRAVFIPLLGRQDAERLVGQAVRLTFRAGQEPFEIDHQIEAME